MLWEIDGCDVEILVHKRQGVHIVQWDDFAKKVLVQADLSKDEAIWCIRKLAATQINRKQGFAVDSLELFDRTWPLKIGLEKIDPYIQHGIVYVCSANLSLTAAQRVVLQEVLFRQEMMKLVGLWEERFNILIPTIAFRKFKTKAYSICLKRELISFDKSLHRFTTELLAYIVFNAISTYVKLEEKDFVTYKTKHFPSHKNYDKVLAYEYRFGISD